MLCEIERVHFSQSLLIACLQPDVEGLTCMLEMGDVYAPEQDVDSGGVVAGPQGRTPLTPKAFRVLETPIVHNIRSVKVQANTFYTLKRI